jgi:hypothetical protein
MQLMVIAGVVVFIGIYYVIYFNKIKKAGGSAAAGRTYWREQFGLDADEQVVSMGIGTWYLGPLVPDTMRSTGEKVIDVLTSTTYRGAMLWIGFTDKNRFALSVEETDDGPKPVASSIGLASGYAPLAIFNPGTARIEHADEAWPGSDQVPRDSQKPKRVNMSSQNVKQELIRITEADGRQMVFFVEPDWVHHLRNWSQTGQVFADPRWAVQPTADQAPRQGQ